MKWFRLRRRKPPDHKVRESRTSGRRPDMLRPELRQLVLAERLGQMVVRRRVRPETEQADVRRVERKLIPRLALLGLRSQAQKVVMRAPQSIISQVQDVFFREEGIPGTKSVCRKRMDRRQVLFRMGIAGRGRRRSPGSGGHYRRSERSQVTCDVVRR